MQISTKTKKLFITATTLAALFCGIPAASQAGVFVSVTIAPPVLPVYVQPPCPVEGYLWTPGYWAYGPEGYYWVPGVWVAPPTVGLLWTPGYWGFGGGIYAWHAGYWGPHVGFYGGVNYGWGYSGVGFIGGVWAGSVFRYNTAVLNVNRTVIRNVYVDRTVIRNTTIVNRTSFNGPGGIPARPTAQERTFMNEHHFAATSSQFSHERTAGQDRSFLASANHGRPPVGAMDRVGGQRFDPQAHQANMNRSPGPTAANRGNNMARPEANPNRGEAYRGQPSRPEASRGEQRPAPQERNAGNERSSPPHPEGHPEAHPSHGEEHPH